MLAVVADAPRSRVRLAGGSAALGSLAAIHFSGEPIDQPDGLLGRAFHAHEPGTDDVDQRGQQNSRRDHPGADQDRHRYSRTVLWRATMPLIVAISLRWLKHGAPTIHFYLSLR